MNKAPEACWYKSSGTQCYRQCSGTVFIVLITKPTVRNVFICIVDTNSTAVLYGIYKYQYASARCEQYRSSTGQPSDRYILTEHPPPPLLKLSHDRGDLSHITFPYCSTGGHAYYYPYCPHSAVLAYCPHSAVLAYCIRSAVLAYCIHSAVLAYCIHSAVLAYCIHSAVLAHCIHSAVVLAYCIHSAVLASTIGVDKFPKLLFFTVLFTMENTCTAVGLRKNWKGTFCGDTCIDFFGRQNSPLLSSYFRNAPTGEQ